MSMPKSAMQHALDCYPNESCGVITGGKYRPCRNDAENKEQHFVINQDDYRQALRYGDLQAVIHSHPDYHARPSQSDKSACEETSVPWGIIEVRENGIGQCFWFEPSGYQAPFIGRTYVWGIHDCLSILLDFYSREMGIELGKFDRPTEKWYNDGVPIYDKELTKNGFIRVDGKPVHGDVILMQIRSKIANHAAIYLESGILSTEPEHYPQPHCILHHLAGQDSRRDIYGGYWSEKTVSIWRHKKSMKALPKS